MNEQTSFFDICEGFEEFRPKKSTDWKWSFADYPKEKNGLKVFSCFACHHRKKDANGNLAPISDYAKLCDNVNKNVIDLIKKLKPKYWFIENPRGGMRKMDFVQELPRYTVTYCQYGDTRMKPTDIWTNHPNPKFKPTCKNGDSCHVSAPRGSATGTQGIKGAKDRSRIPNLLCKHIVDICEE